MAYVENYLGDRLEKVCMHCQTCVSSFVQVFRTYSLLPELCEDSKVIHVKAIVHIFSVRFFRYMYLSFANVINHFIQAFTCMIDIDTL